MYSFFFIILHIRKTLYEFSENFPKVLRLELLESFDRAKVKHLRTVVFTQAGQPHHAFDNLFQNSIYPQ